MFGGPSWKREVVPDHKFDFVDTREFTDNGCGMRFKYLFLYLIILKSFLVYVSDIFTAVTMLTTNGWSNDIYNKCPASQPGGCIPVDFQIGKWVFFGCIIFGFLLLAYEARKAKKIIASRDISYAFTNILANDYYSIRSYDHFCFFDHISNSTKRKDDFAFFVFFTFKGWKRLLLADGPRQSINAITLYSFYLSVQKPDDPSDSWDDFSKYFDGRDLISNILTCVMLFTVLVFACSLLLLIAAGICYVPLLCYVQGNLKEYCCHKVDKRIAEIIRRRNKQRQAKATALARKEAAGDFSHLKNRKGEAQAPLPQPTLPNVSIDDDELDDGSSMRTRGPPPSTYTSESYPYAGDTKYASEFASDYPPMPAYNAPPYGTNALGQPEYNPSLGTVYGEREPYFSQQDDYQSMSHLPLAPGAAPPGGADYAHDPRDPALAGGYDMGHGYPHDGYPHDGHPHGHDAGQLTPPGARGGGLAYDEPQDYPSPTSTGPPPRTFADAHPSQPHGQGGAGYTVDWDPLAHARQQDFGREPHGHDSGAGGRGYAL